MVLTGPERRRRWSEADRRRILTAVFAPGASVTDVSRQYDVSTGLIYKWRALALAARGGTMFSPVVLADEPARLSARAENPAILVELAGGARVSINGATSAALVTATLRALR